MSDDLDLSGMTDREILLFLAKTVPGRLSDHGRRLRALEGVQRWAAGVGAGIALLWGAFNLKIKVGQG